VTTLEKPDLYRLAEGGRTLELRFARCTACDAPSFPHSPYGCPRCGAPADALREEFRDGRATLLGFVTLHARLAPGIEPPQVVGEAEIAPGLIEEVMLAGDETDFTDGMAIRAIPHEVQREGGAVIACRFAPDPEAAP